jgi:hypothetical protein
LPVSPLYCEILVEQSMVFTAHVIFVFRAELILNVGFAVWNLVRVFSLAREMTKIFPS